MALKKKVLPYGTLALGSLMFILGMIFIAAYIRDAIIARAGEPDQSLLFWYIPILYMGIISTLAGLGIGALGLNLLGRRRRGV
jgi:hypothetical protein